jgi:two-component system OmpR family response regulator
MDTRIVGQQTAAAVVALSPIKVLVVEEDLNDLRIFAPSLERFGYQVRACARYSDAVRCLEQEPFDFIVVSQGGPEFEGRPVLERARELNRRAPILIVTRCPDMKCYLEAMQLGALDYVEKPHLASQLAWMVETYLRPEAGSRDRPSE